MAALNAWDSNAVDEKILRNRLRRQAGREMYMDSLSKACTDAPSRPLDGARKL